MFKIIIQENFLGLREKLNLYIKGFILCLEKLEQNNNSYIYIYIYIYVCIYIYIYIYILLKQLDINGKEKEILRDSRQKYQMTFNDDKLS